MTSEYLDTQILILTSTMEQAKENYSFQGTFDKTGNNWPLYIQNLQSNIDYLKQHPNYQP